MTGTLAIVALLVGSEAGAAGPRHQGIRVGVGPAWTSMSAAQAGALELSPVGGLGPRVDLGFEFGLSPRFGFAFLGDMAAMVLPVGADSAPGRTRLRELGFWGGATAWFGELSILAGPTWSAGTGRAEASFDACDPGAPEACGAGRTAVSGAWSSFGGAVSLNLGLFDVPLPGIRPARGGISLCAGAHDDALRTATWAQLALTLAPGRSDG